jgi:hypothetical protein
MSGLCKVAFVHAGLAMSVIPDWCEHQCVTMRKFAFTVDLCALTVDLCAGQRHRQTARFAWCGVQVCQVGGG